MLKPPLVSVVIPVKDGAAYLGQAIESVLSQTYARHEIVVVDGGSRDRSAAIARSYPGVRCIDQAGSGFAGAWNEGAAAAAGDLLAFLDSDDLWMPAKLERQVHVLDSQPDVDYVICRVRFVLEPGHPCPPGFKLELLDGDHVANMPSTLLIRRSAFEAVGPFRTDYSIASDIDWFARAKDLPLTLATVPEPLVHKRVHSRNLSYTAAQNLNRELLDLLRESVGRRRGCSVTVVIPARNAAPYLGEAIESVLSQTLPPEEVIVVDDGSTDATADVAGGFGAPVRCVRQAPSGIGAALNRGLEEARGALLAFLDADDVWMPKKNELQVRALADDASLDMVFGHVRHFHSPELTAAERERLVMPAGLFAGRFKGAMLIRRAAFQRVGPFATQWTTGEFVDWYARAVDAGLKWTMLPDPMVARRLHRDNHGIRAAAARRDYARVLKAVLDRRRAEAP